MNENRRFIETNNFPAALVSRASAKEKQGGGRPDYWEMVFWWTRKPLTSARAVIAASLLPSDTDPSQFTKNLRLNEKVPHRYNPIISNTWKEYFKNKSLLDPFAGFGSIPLEASRLGLSTTAVELLPTAYIFLKDVIEFPQSYGRQLLVDTERWGTWVLEQLKKDSVIGKLYDDDAAALIGSWEVRCPHCSEWTLMVGNWWLARVRKTDGNYVRLVWFEVTKNQQGKQIVSVRDLNKELGSLDKVTVSENTINAPTQSYKIPGANINPRSEQARCLSCGATIRYIDPQTEKHYLESKKLPADVSGRLKWYVKFALEKFYEGDSSLARQRFLIKVRPFNKDLRFEPCSEADQEKLVIARQYLDQMIERNDPDIPTEPISPYSVRYLFPILYGMSRWYHLFNPRQLLSLTTIVKLIREAGKKIFAQQVGKGIPEAKARSYSEAVISYLAIAFCKHVDYNSVVTQWLAATGLGNVRILCPGHTLAMRGISMQWNWVDMSPWADMTGSWPRTLSGVRAGLEYLISALDKRENGLSPKPETSNQVNSRSVNLGDATTLRNVSNAKFDLIVTDPPYYDDVPYTELSDFFFVWLKRALSDLKANKLSPRYAPEAFFKLIGNEMIEIRTQWEEFAFREVSVNPPRFGPNATFKEGVKYFQDLLDASFQAMESSLADQGLLVTYYAHTDPDAWKALLRSGWEISGLTVSNAIPITTESAQSVTKRGKRSLDTSIVVVWRRGASGSILAPRLFDEMIKASKARTQSLIEMDVHGRDLFVGSLTASLSEATRYREIVEMKKLETSELMDKYVLRASLHGLTSAISQRAQVEEGVRSNEGMLYLVVKFLYSGSQKKIVTSDDARVFSLGAGIDLSHAINSLKMFRAGAGDEEGEGSSLAKRTSLVLLEPSAKDRLKVKDLLDYRGVDPENPTLRSSIDALHLLEYFALTYSKDEFLGKVGELKNHYLSEVDEALSLARVISGSLDNDAERDICNTIVEKMAAVPRTVADYLKG